MIRDIKISNFTVFGEANFTFAEGINVIIGSNGTGKSHLLKLAYTASRWSQEMSLRQKASVRPDKATLQKELAGKLIRVYRPDTLGRLSRRGVGTSKAEVKVTFKQGVKTGFDFTFSTRSSTEINFGKAPDEFLDEQTVFLPTKEMLSLFPGFAALYRNYEVSIDETYFDLCLALENPILKGKRVDEIKKFLSPIEEILDGSISLDNGRFYLVQSGKGKFEIHLVAEGFRKLGAVTYLLANGILAKQSILFWDEPETNLNPAYMSKMAELLVAIAKSGTQIFVATHSLYMMRELSMLLAMDENEAVTRSFVALKNTPDGVVANRGESAEDIEPIDALDAEIEQSQRYIDAQEPAGKS